MLDTYIRTHTYTHIGIHIYKAVCACSSDDKQGRTGIFLWLPGITTKIFVTLGANEKLNR